MLGNEKKTSQYRLFSIDLLACYLILSGHFINYIFHIGYQKMFPDLTVLFGCLLMVAVLLAGLLNIVPVIFRTVIFSILIILSLSDAIFTFGTTDSGTLLGISIVVMTFTLIGVFLLRAHINKILIAVFGIMLVATVTVNTPYASVDDAAGTGNSGLPIVVHLILDEHMGTFGMEGLLAGGARMKNDVEAFYLRNKFRIYGQAYSEYFNTHTSLAGAMNASTNVAPLAHITRHRDKYVMTGNRYFETWIKRGYKINILQSSYLDFCHSERITIEVCETYLHDSFDAMSIATLPMNERLKLIGGMYFSSLTVYKLLQLSVHKLESHAFHVGSLWHGRVGPLAVATPMKKFIARVSRSKGSELFFAHLLMPHYPYVYNSDCSVRTPISSWRLRADQHGANSEASRLSTYGDYFDQIKCTMTKIKKMFDVMKANGTFENAIIIVHGDHGARITRRPLVAENAADLTAEDFLDGFSTLFAVKAPDITPVADNRSISLPMLLTYVQNQFGREPREYHEPFVYLADDDGGFVKILMKAEPK